MNFIKDNLLLSMGILLPFLLIAIFAFSSYVSKVGQPAPQYDFLFTLSKYENDVRSIYYSVYDGRLKAEAEDLNADEDKKEKRTRFQHLFHYDAETQNVSEIGALITGEATDSVKLEKFQNAKLDTKTAAPDGYRFEYLRGYNDSGLLGLMFGSGYRYNRNYFLVKDNAHHEIVMPERGYRHYDVQFLGWIKNDE